MIDQGNGPDHPLGLLLVRIDISNADLLFGPDGLAVGRYGDAAFFRIILWRAPGGNLQPIRRIPQRFDLAAAC